MEAPTEGCSIKLQADNPIENAYLVAHFAEQEGRVEWALAIYELLISLGETVAMSRMADLLSAPPHFRDVTRAKRLYQQACVAGYDAACHNLAVVYDQLGDSVSAQKYYRLAKQRGLRDSDSE